MNRLQIIFLISIIFTLAASGSAETISGQVLDYYGTSPVGGVSVQCLETTGADSTVYRFTTGTDGLFSVAVPPATYYVCVNGNSSSSLYYPQYYGGYNYSSYSYTVTVDDGVNVSSILFYMYAGFNVNGIVTHQGNPIEASIIAFDNTTGYYYYGLTGASAGSDGTFTMTLPQGTYEITAYADGHVQPAMLAPVVINDARDITTPIQLVIPETASVSGTVTGPDSEVIEEVRVDAFDMESMYSYSYGYTDENGDYTIPGLVVGRTYLFLCRTNFSATYAYWDLPGTWHPDVTDPHAATPIIIAAAGHTGIDIDMEANGGMITGIVTNVLGEPIENAYVYDFYSPDGLINPYTAIAQRTLYTSESGAYTLTGLAGVVGVAVLADGYIPQIYNGQEMTTLLDTGDPLNVGPDSEFTGINFELTSLDDLGNAPAVTSIAPHLIIKGSSSHITITGTSFNPATQVELVDFFPYYFDGTYPVLNTISVTEEEISLTISTTGGTATGAYYLAITNPDGQYTLVGFAVIEPEENVTFNLLAAPETINANSTLTLSSNTCNLTLQPRAVDGYAGLLLPTGDAIFYDGTNFSMDLIKYYDNATIDPGHFEVLSLEFEIPLGGAALPAGDYLWFAGLFDPGTWDVVDLSMKTITWN